MYQQLRIAVVIPAYNEERAIARVVAEDPLEALDLELVEGVAGQGEPQRLRRPFAEPRHHLDVLRDEPETATRHACRGDP